MKKKLLVLGGTANQLPLIKAAKREGYFVSVCDWTTTNPGLKYADKHYHVSTLDREAVLEAAIDGEIDGVISNSEPAMLNVACLAEKFGLVGNPESAVEILMSKDKFRDAQKNAGLYAPKHVLVGNKEELYKAVNEIGYPLIIKPTESSASRGTTVIKEINRDRIEEAFDLCASFSHNQFVSIEEYVEMPSLTLIDGDIFVNGDTILWDGMFFSRRSQYAPLVPVTQSYPLVLPDDQMSMVKNSIRAIFKEIGIRHGEYNVEMYFDKKGRLFIIEINCRQGGNGIPSMVRLHSGIDMYKLLVTTAVGDYQYFDEVKNKKRDCNYVSRHPIFSTKNGMLKGLYIDNRIREYIKGIDLEKTKGDTVEKVKNATDVVGFASLQFPDYETQHKTVDIIEELIYPQVEEGLEIKIADRNINEEEFMAFINSAAPFFEPQALGQHSTLKQYADKLRNKGTIAYAVKNEKIIGAVIGYTHDTPDNTSYITQVYVLPEYRGQGYSSLLLGKYGEYCKTQCIDKMWLTTRITNSSARRAYEKAGFVEDDSYKSETLVKLINDLH